MDKIKIVVHSLGKIRDAEIEISPLTIFCGDSGLGKSYLAMLVHYFYAILWEKRSRLTQFFKSKGFDYKKMVSSFRGEGEALRFSKKELEEWLAKDAIEYLRYLLKNDTLQGSIGITLSSKVPDEIIFNYKEELVGIVNDDEVYVLLSTNHISLRVGTKLNNNIGDETMSPFSVVLAAELITLLFGDYKALAKAYCLPPSRGPVMTENVEPKSGLYAEFKRQKEELESATELKSSVSEDLSKLIRDILEGEIVQEDGGEYTYITRDAKIPLSAAAASIREIAPLTLIAKRNNVKTISVLFEEPEAHLHPLKQRMVADIVAAFVTAGASMQITTHSDYFLRRINELILMNELKEKNEHIFMAFCSEYNVNEKTALDSKLISAYYLSEREDSTVDVEKQNLENGIPFTSFYKAIKDSFKMQNDLEEYLK
jgi:hypothetical protein